jgi:hypothetical protein
MFPPPSTAWCCVHPKYLPGGFCPGKITLGKILSEISGQYSYQGFKPRDRILESSISSRKILAKNFFSASRRMSFFFFFFFYPSKPFQTPREQNFYRAEFFPKSIFPDRIPVIDTGYLLMVYFKIFCYPANTGGEEEASVKEHSCGKNSVPNFGGVLFRPFFLFFFKDFSRPFSVLNTKT